MTDREALTDVVAALAAAISLLGRTPNAKKAAPSDNMFNQMMADYEKALDAGRAALAAFAPSEAGAVAEPPPVDNAYVAEGCIPFPLADRLRERTAMKYMGDCKCGRCQLVPRELLDEAIAALYAHPSPVPAETEPFCVSLYREAALREPAPVPAEYVRVREADYEKMRRIVWEIAMIDPWSSKEHDELLFDEAHKKARELFPVGSASPSQEEGR